MLHMDHHGRRHELVGTLRRKEDHERLEGETGIDHAHNTRLVVDLESGDDNHPDVVNIRREEDGNDRNSHHLEDCSHHDGEANGSDSDQSYVELRPGSTHNFSKRVYNEGGCYEHPKSSEH